MSAKAWGVLLLLLASGAFAGCRGKPHSTDSRSADGTSYAVSLVLDTESRRHGMLVVKSKLELEGTWRVEPVRPNEVRVGFVELDRATVVVTGTAASAPQDVGAAILSAPVLLRLNTEGAPAGFGFSDEQGPISRLIYELIVLESAHPRILADKPAPALSWTVESVPSSSGRGAVEYRTDSGNAAHAKIRRVRRSYDELRPIGPSEFEEAKERHELRHAFDLELGMDGRLVRAEGSEQLSVHRSTGAVENRNMTLVLTRIEPQRAEVELPLPLPSGESVRFVEPGRIGTDSATRRLLLEQHATGMSSSRILTLLQEMAVAGFRSDQREIFFRSAARIELSPEVVPDLEATLFAHERHTVVRPYILDLLAAAGTPESQGALVRFLSATESRSSADQLASDWARLTYVHRPSKALGEFVLDLWRRRASEEIKSEAQVSLLLGVGGVAHHSSEHHPGLSLQMKNRLVTQLSAVKSGRSQSVLLRALGNARVALPVSLLRSFAESPMPEVRSAAGLAQRHVLTRESEPVLLQLVSDRTRAVQTMALKAAGDGSMSLKGRDRIAGLVLEGRIHPENYARAFELLSSLPESRLQAVSSYMLEDARTMQYLRPGLLAVLRRTEP